MSVSRSLSTRWSGKPCAPGKRSHINFSVYDSTWEASEGFEFDHNPAVSAWVKNDHLGFAIPYTLNGEERNYVPDFIASIDDGCGPSDLLNLILEVTGEKKKDKVAKVATARALWVPSVNNHGGFGRWAFLEISDPWDAQNLIRGFLKQTQPESAREVAHA